MTNALPTKYTKLLLEFKSLPQIEKKRTFMEIAGFPHYENVCSNILSFYINPYHEHGLKDLVLNSIVKTVDAEFAFDISNENIEVFREYTTSGKKRLDLLIITDNYVIGIENKIFHFLNNDLEDYYKTIKLNGSTKKLIGIVLSIKEENAYAGFQSITYNQVFQNIKNNIGKYLIGANTHYTNLLMDFIKTIENLTSNTMEQEKLWSYFKAHAKDIVELRESFNEYEKSLYQKLHLIKNQINDHLKNEPIVLKIDNSDNGIYEDKEVHCLFYNIPVQNYKVTIDARIDFDGWEIWLSTVGRESEDFFINTLCKAEEFSHLINCEAKELYGRKRIVVRTFDNTMENTAEEISTIAKEVLSLLNDIAKYKNRVENNTAQQIANS